MPQQGRPVFFDPSAQRWKQVLRVGLVALQAANPTYKRNRAFRKVEYRYFRLTESRP